MQPHCPFAVILDQGIDRTTKRHSTFYDNTPNGPVGICHISLADPFHERLRKVLFETAGELGIKAHPRGTYCTNAAELGDP
jgi:5'-methylthioadenosine phosphorylase